MQTTINPLEPHKASTLVQTGVFAYTRNPMYLGLLLCIIGVGFYFANVLNVVVIALFVWFITTFQIKPEERILRNYLDLNLAIIVKASGVGYDWQFARSFKD